MPDRTQTVSFFPYKKVHFLVEGEHTRLSGVRFQHKILQKKNCKKKNFAKKAVGFILREQKMMSARLLSPDGVKCPKWAKLQKNYKKRITKMTKIKENSVIFDDILSQKQTSIDTYHSVISNNLNFSNFILFLTHRGIQEFVFFVWIFFSRKEKYWKNFESGA